MQKLVNSFNCCGNKETKMESHMLSDLPNKAWNEILSKEFIVSQVSPPLPDPEKQPNHVRVVCVSDTHNLANCLKIPDGDILIHAGDFSITGQKNEVVKFNQWLGSLPHRYKVVIAGNHELTFDKTFNKTANMKQYLTNCIYLEDSGVELLGLKIWGTPHQPEFGGWAFNVPRGAKLMEKWNLIPADIDILISHSPPVGIGDFCNSNVHAGDVDLLNTIMKRLKLILNVFGHIHEGYGVYQVNGCDTVFVNASNCDIRYDPVNPPIVLDLPVEETVGQSSSSQLDV